MKRDVVDTVVIGAGAAGLHAAAEIARAGRTVVLLEARDRVGGRIWTQRPANWPGAIELGAEFVHGGNAVLEKLMRAGCVRQKAVKERHWYVERGRRRAIPDLWERVDSVLGRIGPGFRGSFGDWLRRHGRNLDPLNLKLAKTFVKGFQGASLDRMSAQTLSASAQGGEEQFRITRGYGQLVSVLMRRLHAERVSLLMDCVVRSIEWRRGHAKVLAGEREWRAKTVLLTVPLGVLQARRRQAGYIQFAPELTTRRRLWRKVACGHAVRVVLRMRADVWRRGVVPSDLRGRSGEAFGFLHSTETFFPVWWTESPQPVLVGWTGGLAAKSLCGLPPARLVKLAWRTLSKLLGCSESALQRATVDWRTHDWAADPLTRGAYSFSMAGQENAPRLMAQPCAGTLFFAGEATADPQELGTVHGALASGERAAREIIVALERARQR